MSSSLATHYSLISRAIDHEDGEAWDQLYQRYSRFIYYILNELIGKDDLDDLHQQVMVILLRDIEKYDRTKGRFRSWLSKVIRTTCLMHYRKRDSLRVKQLKIENEFKTIEQVQEHTLDNFIESEWKHYVMSIAMERVRKSTAEKHMQVFELDLEGHSISEIADQTGETVANIYSIRKRVKKSLVITIQSVIKEIEW